MYNLFVHGMADAWDKNHLDIELGRCLREYTDDAITAAHGELTADDVAVLKNFPCLFAYETSIRKAPKFGVITNVIRRNKLVRIEFELIEVQPFILPEHIMELQFDLDITDWEMNRSHWALKIADLPAALHKVGVNLPRWARSPTKLVDVRTHRFPVALSFPGSVRDALVDRIVPHLEALIGPNAYFYDLNYQAQLARPNLDALLLDIYRNRSDLIVVFLNSDYESRDWCGLEFRAVQEIIFERSPDRIMYVRTDDAPVAGVLKTDGYVDARRFSPRELADMIRQRVTLIT